MLANKMALVTPSIIALLHNLLMWKSFNENIAHLVKSTNFDAK